MLLLSSEYSPPPRPPYALLSPSCSGVGLYPTRGLLDRLGGFSQPCIVLSGDQDLSPNSRDQKPLERSASSARRSSSALSRSASALTLSCCTLSRSRSRSAHRVLSAVSIS